MQKNIYNRQILIVDDDTYVRHVLSSMLRKAGFIYVRDVMDAKQALALLDDNAYCVDLIISDWNMPHKSGFDFLREIRTTHPYLPFIMVTSRFDESSILSAKNIGVSSYLRKPFSADELHRKVTIALKK